MSLHLLCMSKTEGFPILLHLLLSYNYIRFYQEINVKSRVPALGYSC